MNKTERDREDMRNWLRRSYGREPTEKEADEAFQIYEVDHNKIRCFFRGLSRTLGI